MRKIVNTDNFGRLLAVTVLVASIVLVLRGSGDTTRVSSQSDRNSRKPPVSQDEQAPIAAFDEAEKAAPAERSRRLEKSRHYNNLNLVIEQMPGYSVRDKSGHWHLDLEPIPAPQSNLIITGTVIESAAHLSADKTGVYSEFTVTVDEVIKPNNQVTVSISDKISLDRVGGAVRFRSGQVQRMYPMAQQRLPQLGTRYLFFLKVEGNIFSILTAFELREGKVFALDKIQKFQAHDGTDDQSFLRVVRSRPFRNQRALPTKSIGTRRNPLGLSGIKKA